MKLTLITRLSAALGLVQASSRFPRQTEAECKDTSDQCATWKTMNLCKVANIQSSCPVTCDACDSIPAPQTQSNNSTCEDTIEMCSNFASQCDKINIRNGCRKTCNLCDGNNSGGLANVIAGELCQDALPSCDILTEKNGCESLIMKAQCAKTCKVCEAIVAPIVDKITAQDSATTATPEAVSVSKSDPEVENTAEAAATTTTIAVENDTTPSETVSSETEENDEIDVVEILEDEASGGDEVTSPPVESSSDSNITVVTTKASTVSEETTASSTSLCLSVLVLVITALL